MSLYDVINVNATLATINLKLLSNTAIAVLDVLKTTMSTEVYTYSDFPLIRNEFDLIFGRITGVYALN